MRGMKFYLCNVMFFLSCMFLISCADYSRPVPGRDKQGAGLLSGAIMGAGSGMITGGQFAASVGPGAFIGMGFGALWGSLYGLGLDVLEEEDLYILSQVAKTDDEVTAQYVLLEHFELKAELHPGRDIFPADVFFNNDETELSRSGNAVAQLFSGMLAKRNPASRIEIIAYQVSKDKTSSYAQYLGKKRTLAIGNALVRAGIEPRRLVFKSIILDNPIVHDRYDKAERYFQAVEFALLDM